MKLDSVECPRCHNTDPDRFATVFESTGYVHRRFGNEGAGHGDAALKGWRCLNCGETKSLPKNDRLERWPMDDDAENDRPPLHCWEAGPDMDDGCGTTCMLVSGHSGAHDWSRDDQIVLAFQ